MTDSPDASASSLNCFSDSPSLKRLRETHPYRRHDINSLALYAEDLEDAITALDESNEALRAQLAEVDRAMIEATAWNEPMLRRFLQDGPGARPYKAALAREQARLSEREVPEVK